MSLIETVMQRTGASRADVVRVATHGGASASDWEIAHAIETASGRPAADIMWAARSRAPEPETPTQSNDLAVYDPEIRVYGEDTAPDAPPAVLADHPHESDDEPIDQIDQVEETDPGRAAWNALLHTHVWADVAALTGATPGEIALIIGQWATARDAMAGMRALIARRRAARTPNRTTIAAALAA